MIFNYEIKCLTDNPNKYKIDVAYKENKQTYNFSFKTSIRILAGEMLINKDLKKLIHTEINKDFIKRIMQQEERLKEIIEQPKQSKQLFKI